MKPNTLPINFFGVTKNGNTMILEKRTDGDYYTITSEGNVKTCNWRNTGREGVLRPAKDQKGYLRVGIMINGKLSTRKVHRLVATAFVPNPENKPQVNHKDGDKLNNHYTNLEWTTNKENANHAIKKGLFCFSAGWNKGISNTKLSEKEVIEIREHRDKNNYTFKKLAEMYNISESNISRIINKTSWTKIL